MKILENKTELQEFLKEIPQKGKKIGLIPTMGSIHQGHLSLIKTCQELGYFSLVTIFVNPTQFNDLNDFEMYPRNIDNDKKSLESVNTDLLFFPATKDLYPGGIKSEKTVHEYRNILCDINRPDHFDGVTTVVNSLFDLIKPDHVFFGEKDFQQLKIIQKMLENNRSSIIMHPCPSIRMSNGISYSSRYKKFSISEEKIFNDVAKTLMRSISDLRKNFNIKVIEDLKKKLIENGLKKIDYLEIKNGINLLPAFEKNNSRLFVAFYIGKIRIIDNFILY
jgi:pantoate--beta-alanine ligase